MSKLVIALGGSNSIGRGSGGPVMTTASSLVTVWNNTNDAGANGTAWISPPAAGNAPWDTSGTLGNNYALWFCHRMALEYNEPVRLIVVGRSSASIDEFTGPSGVMWQEFEAVWAAAAPGVPADVFLSGITTTDDEGTYEAEFLALVAALESNSYLAANAPTIIDGAIVTDDSFLEAVAVGNSGVYFAPVTALVDKGDGAHFIGASYYHWGYDIHWQAYQEHTGPRIVAGGSPFAFGG